MSSDRMTTDGAPAVLGPEFGAVEVLYLPARRMPDGQVGAELRALTDARLALLVYTSLDSLRACCGREQPWISIRATGLDAVRYHCGADVVGWDEALPAALREAV